MRERNALLVSLLAFAAGLEYITVIYRFPIIAKFGLSSVFVSTFVILGPITFVLVVRSVKGSLIIVPLLVLIGVIVGIMVDVVLDTKVDRNIFPIEIIFWCIFLAPALLVTSALGWLLKYKPSKTT
jgi:hypothetical protein